MASPKPKPTAIRVLTGNPSKRPLPAHEPTPAALAEAPPPELGTGAARDEWQRTIRGAIRCGMVAGTDRALAIAHCRLWARWMTLADAVDRGAALVQGQETPNDAPALKALALLLRVDAELGFSPTARTAVQAIAPKTRKDNPLAKYLSQAG